MESTLIVYNDLVPEGLLALIVLAGAVYLLKDSRRRSPPTKRARR